MNIFEFHIPEWFFVALNLLILVVVLRKVLWNPIHKILDARKEKIDTALKTAQELETEKRAMEQLLAEHTAELDRLTASQMQDARVRAGREYDRIVSTAEEKARSIIAAAQASGERERESMLQTARTEIVSAALATAEALLEANIDQQRNERIIEAVLSKRSVTG